MMNAISRKYNPGFLSDDELIESFCVRKNEFLSIIEMLCESTGGSNPHQIVIGPRGSGKTSLLLRVAAEIRRDATMSTKFFPVVFAEESYEVSTAGEFWLECLSRLAIQAPCRESGADLHRTYDELRVVHDDRALGERCLGALLDFSDREDKRLVLFVENMNTMFRDMADPDAGWRLRKILQTEPRIVLLASATSRFEQIDAPDQALYDLFRVTTLRPLETEECAVLWETVSGQGAVTGTIRSLRILTGGNPRLFVIVARFGAGLSFRELMADLLDLVDEHTEYFRSHLESLPAQERRVYLALADLWKPATTKEIAERARLDTSKCSAQLARLAERGVVEVAGGTARRRQYYLTERMYNIYYLLRRPRGPDRLVDSLIRFMESFYSPRELRDIVVGIAREAKDIDEKLRTLHEAAFTRLLALPALGAHRAELFGMCSMDISEAPARSSMLPGEMKPEPIDMETTPPRNAPARFAPDGSPEAEGRKLLHTGATLLKRKRLEEAMATFEEVARRYGESSESAVFDLAAKALMGRGAVFLELKLFDEALETCEEVVRRYGVAYEPTAHGAIANILIRQGTVLGGQGRSEHALSIFDEVVRRFGTNEASALVGLVASAMLNKGFALDDMGRTEEALAAYDEVARRYGASDEINVLGVVGKALSNKGSVLGVLDRLEEALEVFDEIVRRFASSDDPELVEIVTKSLIDKGYTLGLLGRPQDALTAYDEAILHPGELEESSIIERVAIAFVYRGSILVNSGRAEEALASYGEAIRRFDTHGESWRHDLVTQAFIHKVFALVTLNRFAEATEACDDVVRRFGVSEESDMVSMVADALYTKGNALLALNRPLDALAEFDEALRRTSMADNFADSGFEAKMLLSRGIAFDWLNRPEEALAAYDEVVHRFGESKDLYVNGPVASALERKVPLLDDVDRHTEARAAHEELVRRLGDGAPEYNTLLEGFMVERAGFELADGKYDAAIEAAGLALGKYPTESVDNRLRALFIRAKATFANGDVSGCERDIEVILTVLPTLDILTHEFLYALMELSIKLGIKRMRELIEVSASSDILLPLTTALALDAGARPRVAREVEEVARDIRKKLESMKNGANLITY